MTEIKITLAVDLLADAAYVQLSSEPIVRTARVNAEVLVDLDATDMVVGIETLRADAPIPFSELETRFHVRSEVIEALRMIRPNPGAFVEFYAASDASASVNQQPVLTH
jgi:uncharacterized protein YuzE